MKHINVTVSKRRTSTSRFWPILWALACACKSTWYINNIMWSKLCKGIVLDLLWVLFETHYTEKQFYYNHKWKKLFPHPSSFPTWGFQSVSNMMTVSAACRFIPTPPARMLKKNGSQKPMLWVSEKVKYPKL